MFSYMATHVTDIFRKVNVLDVHRPDTVAYAIFSCILYSGVTNKLNNSGVRGGVFVCSWYHLLRYQNVY